MSIVKRRPEGYCGSGFEPERRGLPSARDGFEWTDPRFLPVPDVTVLPSETGLRTWWTVALGLDDEDTPPGFEPTVRGDL